MAFLSLFLFAGMGIGWAKSEDNHDWQVKKGQRLFYGLVGEKSKAVNCGQCHHSQKTDTINWNPTAFEVAHKFDTLQISQFQEVLVNPMGKRLSVAHKGVNLNDEQIGLVKMYLHHLEEIGPIEKPPEVLNLALFLVVLFLVLSAIGDLLVTNLFPRKRLHIMILLMGGGYLIFVLGKDAKALGYSQGFAPDQPIKFSHKVHTQDNKIDCKYCHNTVETSKSAGIPCNNLCLNCHVIVREGTYSGQWEIAKIHQHQKEKKSVAWIRVHKLPDHVYFNHAQHSKVGRLDCTECHGPVKEMHILKQRKDLSMGWCLECHRSRGVDSFNGYYKTYDKLMTELQKGQRDSILVKEVGGTNCMRCHY